MGQIPSGRCVSMQRLHLQWPRSCSECQSRMLPVHAAAAGVRSWSRSNWRSVIVIGSEKHGNRSLLWRAKLMSIWCAAIATMTRCTSGETGVLLRLRSRRTQPAWVFADSFADPSNDPSQFRCESMSRVKTSGKGNTKTKNKARGNQGLCKSVSKARFALLSDF